MWRFNPFLKCERASINGLVFLHGPKRRHRSNAFLEHIMFVERQDSRLRDLALVRAIGYLRRGDIVRSWRFARVDDLGGHLFVDVVWPGALHVLRAIKFSTQKVRISVLN